MTPSPIEQAARVIWSAAECEGDPVTLETAKAIAQALHEAGMLVGGWRPIEEAPKDGSEVLTFHPGLAMGQMVLFWSDGYWREKANMLGLKSAPTHFMPLPTPPEGK